MKRTIHQYYVNELGQLTIKKVIVSGAESEKPEAKSQKSKTKNEKKWEFTDGRSRGIPD